MVTPFGKEDVNRNKQKNDNGSEHNTTKYVTLKDVHILLLKEVQLPTLQLIPLDTYMTIAATIEKLRQQKYDGMDANVRDRIVKLICVSAELLLDVRYHKLLEQYSAHKDKNDRLSLRDSAIIPAAEYSKLTDEEKYILDAEKQTKKRKMAILAATLQGRPKVLE